MRAEIHPCRIDDIQLAGALVAEYAAECRIAGIGEPSGQWDAYRLMEASGLLQSIGAFVAGELVGFVNVLVSVLPHYGKPVGVTESLFVASGHRASGAGLALLAAAEDYALERGAVGILVSAPHGGQLERVLDARPSYRRTNAVFFRGLQ